MKDRLKGGFFFSGKILNRIRIIQRINISEFLSKASSSVILDVRSPGEYAHAHIPGAISLSLFSDEERKVVGTTYKQQSREQAILTGLEYFGPKMKTIVEEVIEISKGSKEVMVHCWRGGMRSGAVAWLLDLYGFSVSVLEGGYKSYRNFVLQKLSEDHELEILGGYTGSGKTRILHQLQQQGHNIIDLEALANHRGSAFGSNGTSQPSPEMFENLIVDKLISIPGGKIWIEDESQRIGVINIPHSFWKTMRSKPVIFLDIPFEERLKSIVNEYRQTETEKLIEAVFRIQKRLGPLEAKTAIAFLKENDHSEAFRILLKYYDKVYDKGRENRSSSASTINKIGCNNVDMKTIIKKIEECANLAC